MACSVLHAKIDLTLLLSVFSLIFEIDSGILDNSRYGVPGVLHSPAKALHLMGGARPDGVGRVEGVRNWDEPVESGAVARNAGLVGQSRVSETP